MHHTSNITFYVNITHVIPIYFECMPRFVFQYKVELLLTNVPYNIYEIIFITIFTDSFIIKIDYFCFTELFFRISRTLYR